MWIACAVTAIDVDPAAARTTASQSPKTVLQVEPNNQPQTTNEEFVNAKSGRNMMEIERNVDDGLVELAPVPPQQIVDGTTVLPGEYPAFAFLSGIGCGATLIHSDILLTAGHCVATRLGSNFNIGQFVRNVFLGGTKRDGSDAMETLRVISGRLHPNYTTRTFSVNTSSDTVDDYDYALLQLSNPSSIVPIPYNRNGSIPYDTSELITIGHGLKNPNETTLSYNLLQVRVNAINTDKCRSLYNNEIDAPSTLCAAAKGKSACYGDSGGPLLQQRQKTIHITKNNGRLMTESEIVLVGIVSGGVNCEVEVYPGLYSRVSTVADTFIRNGICDMSQYAPSDCPPKSNTCSSCGTNAWLGPRFGSGTQMYFYNARRNVCRKICHSSWSVFFWKLLGWKCGATCPT
jgi:Trypsin